MIGKIREIVLTRVSASERMEIRQSEKKRLKKDGTMAALMIIAVISISAIAISFIRAQTGVPEDDLEYGFGIGYMVGIGLTGIALLISRIGEILRRYDAPTEEEMEELGDRII